MAAAADPGIVVAFWREAGEARWFAKDDAFDVAVRAALLDAHMRAAARGCDGWAATADGALALVLLLDQVPRNAFRGTAHMFATDGLARMFAGAAIARGQDAAIPPELRQFLYLPFEHAEDPADQDRAVALMATLGEVPARWARLHRDIIARFGRFPHRNALLGRESTAAERAFLAEGGFAG